MDAIPETLAGTERVCSSVNLATTRAGINMDAVCQMGMIVKKTADLTARVMAWAVPNWWYSAMQWKTTLSWQALFMVRENPNQPLI
jgi:hypothetical protein